MSPLESKVKEKNEISDLEHKLSLKQLQLNGLMSITQAINDNVKEQGLFQMYSDFINWQLGVKKMALFIQKTKSGSVLPALGRVILLLTNRSHMNYTNTRDSTISTTKPTRVLCSLMSSFLYNTKIAR